MIRTRVRHTIRDLREIIENQDLAAAETKLRSVMTTVEKAVTKGVLQRNTASRYISRLSHQVAALRAS